MFPQVTIHIGMEEFRPVWGGAMGGIHVGVKSGVRLGCEEGAEEARRTGQFKDRTGALRKSIRGALDTMDWSGAIGHIEATEKYASYVEEGTKAHDIHPKAGHGFVGPLKPNQGRRKKTDVGTHRVALRWYDSGGGAHFAGVVHHPGTQPHPFMGQGLQKAERVIIREVELGVQRGQHILDT